MWLELNFELNPDDDNEFVVGAKGKSDLESTKSSMAYYLWQLMRSEDFTLNFADKINNDQDTGSHFGVVVFRVSRVPVPGDFH